MKLCVILPVPEAKELRIKKPAHLPGKASIAHAVDIARGSAIFDQVIVFNRQPGDDADC